LGLPAVDFLFGVFRRKRREENPLAQYENLCGEEEENPLAPFKKGG